MIPTLFGIVLVCFILIQFVPGGPVEEYLSRAQAAAQARGGGIDASKTISPEQIEAMKAYFGFDKPAHVRFFEWIGKVIQLDLGQSTSYGEPVWDVISSRFPVSLFFGLGSLFLSYLISVPLGIFKAVKHGSAFDTWSSIAVFSGYVIPGYALGIVLIVLFSGGSYLDWFPLGGLTSDDYAYMNFGERFLDVAYHLVLPMTCFMIGEFAFLTFLIKNSVMEELGKDYMRAALARGLSFRQALLQHALRNALIPLATRSGEIFTLLFTGSLLIEKVFDIDGMGRLFYSAMMNRDYNVVLGIILLSSFLGLIGRLFSDLLYTWIDPRIHFR